MAWLTPDQTSALNNQLSRLLQGPQALHLVGMPAAHGEIFAQIAQQEKCVISSRQLGRVCTRLMTEGYDTKGFRIKSKSCDFGPMAGFVCVDPRLHKKGAAYNEKQAKDVAHAMHGDKWDKTNQWRASSEQICITQERLDELINWPEDPDFRQASIAPRATSNPDVLIGTVVDPITLYYVLRRVQRFGDTVWALYISPKDPTKVPGVAFRNFDIIEKDLGLEPCLALVNPYPPYPKGHYKNCCTGDYDLFGVWPRNKRYDPMGEDRRIAGMSRGADRNANIIKYEDPRIGNISNRVALVAGLINSRVPRYGKYARDVIHHSDEGGRPFIDGIEDHVIAFVPLPNRVATVGVRMNGKTPHQGDWTTFLSVCSDAAYTVIINDAWSAQLNTWMMGHVGATGDARGWRTHSPLT